MIRYRSFAEIDKERKLIDKNTAYIVTVKPPSDIVDAFYQYAKDFHDAAHRIASLLLEDETEKVGIGQLDTYFFPLAFLYRHSLELVLKAIAFKNIPSDVDKAAFAKKTFHDLEMICTEALKITPCNRDVAEQDWVQKLLADASTMDKESDSFRYPFHIIRPRKSWGETDYAIKRVFEKQTHIDLYKFANKMEIAFSILEAWYLDDESEITDWKDYSPIFIEEGGNYYTQAVVGYGYNRADFYPYFSGYGETAGFLRKMMIDEYDKSNTVLLDKLFMPMCYLYRNTIELCLKACWIEEIRVDYQRRLEILDKKKHSIEVLWNKIQEWIVATYTEDQDALNYLDEIKTCSQYIHTYDSDASRFRYPCTKHITNFSKTNIKYDVVTVADFMESLITSIDDVSAELAHRREIQEEAEAEYRSEMMSEYVGEYF